MNASLNTKCGQNQCTMEMRCDPVYVDKYQIHLIRHDRADLRMGCGCKQQQCTIEKTELRIELHAESNIELYSSA